MDILLVVAYFYPEIGSASHLFLDLALELIKKGHKVQVLTSYPRDHLVKDNKKNKYPKKEVYKDIIIHRTLKFEVPRDIILSRGFEHFVLPLLYFIKGIRIKNIDAVIVYSPPLPLFLFGFFYKKFRKTPFILNVQDLYPQTLIDVGMLKNKLLIKIFDWLEQKAYKNSDFVTAHSENNLNFIRKKGAIKNRSGLVYNWTDTDAITPGERNNGFRKNHNIGDNFLITYAGIMSYHQDLESVVKSAQYTKQYKDIIIYLIGDGVQKEQLEDYSKNNGYKNLYFLPLQEKEEYVQILQASDASIVTLGKEVKTPVVPGKLINIMSAGIPVIGNVPSSSDAYDIILKSKCGYVIEPGNPKGLAQMIVKMYKSDQQKLKKMGNNGRQFMKQRYSSENAVEKFEEIFKNIKL